MLVKRRNFLTLCLTFPACLVGFFFRPKPAYSDVLDALTGNSVYDTVFTEFFGSRPVVSSEELRLTLPEMAEDGAAVPIEVRCGLENVRKIFILVEKNPTPLIGEFDWLTAAPSIFSTRIKMAESSHVVVIAERNGQLFGNREWVEVSDGGCGTG